MDAPLNYPVIGRFLSTDPAKPNAGDPRYFGRYQYGHNSPYRYNDPDGRAPKGFTLGLDGSAFGVHVEVQGAVAVDFENGDVGAWASGELGAENPDMPDAGIFGSGFAADDGIKMDELANGVSLNVNSNVGKFLSLEVVRYSPVDRMKGHLTPLTALGVSEIGFRIGLDADILPVSAGMSRGRSYGMSGNPFSAIGDAIGGVVNAVGGFIGGLIGGGNSGSSDPSSSSGNSGDSWSGGGIRDW